MMPTCVHRFLPVRKSTSERDLARQQAGAAARVAKTPGSAQQSEKRRFGGADRCRGLAEAVVAGRAVVRAHLLLSPPMVIEGVWGCRKSHPSIGQRLEEKARS